jgi:EAL domain-containing protein (putative c-di-GMP-specific phosphodiesterase class I)
MNMLEMMAICRCSEDDILNLTESELIKVANACRKANPLFFAKREAAAAQTREWMKSNPDLINQFLNRSGNSKEAQPH